MFLCFSMSFSFRTFDLRSPGSSSRKTKGIMIMPTPGRNVFRKALNGNMLHVFQVPDTTPVGYK